jgi:hypothetical protein
MCKASDFDWWFARVIYEFQFAMAIYDSDLLGHSRINPKVNQGDALAQQLLADTFRMC